MAYLKATLVYLITVPVIFFALTWMGWTGILPPRWALICLVLFYFFTLYYGGWSAHKYLEPTMTGKVKHGKAV